MGYFKKYEEEAQVFDEKLRDWNEKIREMLDRTGRPVPERIPGESPEAEYARLLGGKAFACTRRPRPTVGTKAV